MRDAFEEIERRGARLVIVGNGNARFAQGFREDLEVPGTLLVDPELRAYRAAGLRRGRVEVLSPRLIGNAARAASGGFRQGAVQGDPWQLGGAFVIRPGGEVTLAQASREAGDHVAVVDVLEALEADAPVVRSPAPTPIARALGRVLGHLVDPTIALSFDRTGFLIHALRFDPADLEIDLTGRRCLVTGANSGIGFETALGLADLGAQVVMLCRNEARGLAAAERVRECTGNARVEAVVLDVSDLAGVRRVGAALAAEPVHVLVHNAGVLPDERTETAAGLETTFATHVAGPHLLTEVLTPALEAAGDARVVFVSSGGMYTRKLRVEDPQWRQRPYDGVVAYAETKRAQVVLAELWADRLRDRGVAVNAMHPGWADTPSVQTSLPLFHRLTEKVLRSPAEGADTVVWLAASQPAGELTGHFLFDREPRRTHLLPFTRETEDERQSFIRLCEVATRLC